MRNYKMSIAAIAATLGAVAFAPGSAQADNRRLDIDKISSITGMKGDFIKSEGVYRLLVPREDLQVTINGVKAVAALGVQSKVAFSKISNTALVRGEFIVTEGQVDKVMGAALDSGLQVTALANKYMGDNPKLMSLHVLGADNEEKLATAAKAVFDAIKESASESLPTHDVDTSTSTLNTKAISEALGLQGESRESVYVLHSPKSIRFGRFAVSPSMGAQSELKFAGSDEQAVATGEIAATSAELQNVLKALRDAKIHVHAIHNHMLVENPRLIFVSYMGVGPAQELAKGLKAALPKQTPARR